MMTFRQGKLLQKPVEALVNAVNTVGVMFKEAFPANFRAYEENCRRKEVRIGKMFVTGNLALEVPIG
jgi:hypothetical protein